MDRTKRLLGLFLVMLMLLAFVPLQALAADAADPVGDGAVASESNEPQTTGEETPTKGYHLTIYNADGTVGMEIDGTKSASAFCIRTAIEDARVFVDNASLFGITTPATYVIDMYENSTENESFEIGSDVTINGNGFEIVCADGVTVTNNGTLNDATIEYANTYVAQIGDVKYATLAEALEAAVVAGDSVTVKLLADVNLTGTEWTPVYFNSYIASGANTLVIDSNYCTITGLSDMLFSGIWTGTKFEVKNLTIDGANIQHDAADEIGTIGVGAIVGNVSAIKEVVLDNVKLTNSHVEGGHWTGGFFGYIAGYSGNDGPVFTTVSITNSEVSNSEIIGKGSVGGVVGHATGDAWTSFGIESSTVIGNTITSTGSSTNKAGIVAGTIGAAGTAQTTNGTTLTGGVSVSVTEKENEATSNGEVITTVYGRQGSSTGVIEITGGTYENYPIEENVPYAAPAEGYAIKENADGTYGVEEIQKSLAGSGTEEDPYLITSFDDLKLFRDLVNNGTYVNVYVVLTDNIDMEQEDWVSIGTSTHPFTGTFDGKGFTISNIWSYERGLFGYTSKGNYVDSGLNGRATIKNLTINGVEVYNQSVSAVGGLVGQTGQNTEISNVTVTGYISIYGYGYVGGIVGQGYAHIDNCQVIGVDDEYGDQSTISANYWAVGGIIGHAGSEGGASITNCSVENVKIYSAIYGAGAIAGVGTTGPIENVSAENVVIEAGSDPDANGFLVGCNYDKITGNSTAKNITMTVGDAVVSAPQDMVANVNGTYYISLQAAVDAANTGDTITILANVADEAVTVNKNVTITSDADNKVTLNNVSITINGTDVELTVSNLKFTGSSYINAGNGKALTVTGVEANVEPAKITGRAAFIVTGTSEPTHGLKLVVTDNVINSAQSGTDYYSAAIFGWRYIDDGSVISGNTFGTEDNRYTFVAVKTMNAMDGATITIANNTIYGTSESYVLLAFDLYQNNSRANAYTVISNSNVIDATVGSSYPVIAFNISGNTAFADSTNITLLDNGTTVNGNALTLADIDANDAGSDYDKYYGVDVVTDANGKIIGGTFGGDMAALANDIADGYEVVDGVVSKVQVAEVNGVKYATLAEAAAAAQAGDEIVLLADAYIAEGTDVTIPSGVILNGNGFSIYASGADYNTTTNFGYVIAGGNLTIKGITKIEKFSASYYDHVITIGEGASLQVFGKNRVSLGYGSSFDIAGSIDDAKTADKSAVTPSLVISAGISIVGANDTYLKANNAYVVIGSTSSKNSNAGGTFDITFDNCIVEFTNQFTTVVPKYDTLNPVFNVTFENSTVTAATKFCFMAPGSNVVVDGSDVTLGSYLHNSGSVEIKNGSTFVGSMIQYGENGGNSGTITVDNASFTINNNNVAYAMDGKDTGKLILTNGATASVDYIKATEITIGVGTELTTKSADLTANTEPGYEVEYADGKYVAVLAPVAQIGDVKYATLQDALNAAQAGDTIVLLADATTNGSTAQIPAGVTIKSNGYEIDGSIRMLGDLTLDGPLTITGGLWVGKGGETLTATLAGDKLSASYFMFQHGAYTINADIDATYGYLSYNGTFEVNSTIHTTGANGEVLYINGNVTLNNGAVLDSDNSVFVCNDNASLTIKSGAKVDSNVKITVAGAELYSAGDISGTINNSANGTIAISGGTYTMAIPEAWCANGYIPVDNGDGTYGIVKDPYAISSLEELKAFRDKVNAGDKCYGETWYLTTDIDLLGEEWTPIGTNDHPFQGTFDGKEYTISNLVITGRNDKVGLFGRVNNTGGELKNLTIRNAMVSGDSEIGALVATPGTFKISNIKLTGHVEIDGYQFVGAVGGKNANADWNNVIVDVDETSFVKATSTVDGTKYTTHVGGVIGMNGNIAHSLTNISSNIKVIGDVKYIGGLFGTVNGNNTIENVTFTGTVEAAEGATHVGAIAGVWVNTYDQEVVINNADYTNATVKVGDTAVDQLVGGVYYPTQDTADTSGKLIVDGEQKWPLAAKIGSNYYATLEEAIAAAQAGETVELLGNVTVTGSGAYIMLTKAITIDGNGYTVSMKQDTAFAYALLYLYAIDGTVTIKDTTFDGITSGAVIWAHDADVVIDNCVFQNGNHTQVQGLVRTTCANLTLTNSEFINNNCNFVITFNYDAAESDKMVVENCTFSGNTVNDTAVIYYVDGASSTITDSSFVGNTVNSASHGAIVYYSNGQNGTVTGNEFIDNTITAAGARATVLALEAGTTATENAFVNNTCTSTASGTTYVGTVLNKADADSAGVVISGNYWNGGAPDVIVSKGAPTTIENYYTTYENGVLGGLTAIAVPVAEVNGVKYATLQAAIDAANAGETITLLADVELDAPITVTKSITIDGNGNKITQSANCDNTYALLYFDANDVLDITIKNVTFDGIKGGAAIRTLGANMTIDNCVFQNCEHTQVQGLVRLTQGKASITNTKFLNNNCSMAVSFNYDTAGLEGDTFVIDNCVFEGNTADTTAIVYYVKGDGCTITNSEFVGNTVNCSSNGAVIYLGFQEDCKVTGCLFENNTVTDSSTSKRVAGAIFFGYEADISGNAFINNTATNANGDVLGQVCTSTHYDCEIDLSGNYWGGEAPVYGKDYTVQHQTGEAEFALNDYYTSYTLDANGNVVVDDIVTFNYVAQVGKFKYETVTEAINACADGGTVQLLAGTISETINPWGTDSTHASEKSITIVGAEDFGTILTGGLYLGYDDSGCRAHTITIKGIAFEGKGILVAGQQNVVIEGNKFTNITTCVATTQSANANAISIIGKNVNATIKDNVIDTTASGGIHLRDVANATVTGNTVANTNDNAITINPTAGSNGEFVITDNVLSNWGLGGEGRAIRVSGGATVEINGNVMIHEAAPEQFVKVTGATSANVNENYWSGKSPVDAGVIDVAAATPENYYADVDKTILVNIAFVAEVNGVKYSTLAEAIAAAGEGDVIVLLDDVTVDKTLEIAAGKSFTLDLAGKTITAGWNDEAAGKHIYVIENHGTLVITGNGTINTRGIYNHGNLTLENGTINAIDANGGYGVRNYEGAEFIMNGGSINTIYEDGDIPGDGYDATPVGVDEGATFVMNGGTINNISNFTVAIYNSGTTTIYDGTVTSVHTTVANYGTITINGGTFTCNGLDGITAHAIWAASGKTTINGGTFDGKDNFNGFNVDASAGAVVDINGGNFLSVHSGSLYGDGTITVYGGTFFDDVAARCAEGYGAIQNLDGKYVVGELPTATVNNMGSTVIPEGEWITLGGTATGDLPLSFVMQFLADQDAADMANSPYADWYADFVITFTGIEDGSFLAEGCYLAGYYGDFGWVKVPVDDMTVEEGVRYPVMLGYGAGQKYEYICTDVKDFRCALYLTPEVLAANPNIQVNLELAVVDNSQGGDAAIESIMNGTSYKVADYDYVADDFAVVAQVGDKLYASLQEAINAANGATVVVLTDIELDASIVVEGTVVLDLNGKTVSYTTDATTAAAMITNYGALTIEDSVGTGKLVFTATNPSTNAAYASNTISNRGTLIVNGGTIENASNGSASYAIDAYAGSTTEINGGEIKAVRTTVRIFTWTNGSTVTLTVNDGYIYSAGGYGINLNLGNAPAVELAINGGTIETDNTTYPLAVYAYGASGMNAENVSISITDGTFEGDVALNGALTDTMAADAVTVSGGTFNGDWGVYSYGDDSVAAPVIAIIGGTYKTNYSEMYATDDGYIFEQNEDGIYTAVSGEFVEWSAFTISAGTSLDMNFYLNAATMIEGQAYYAKVTKVCGDTTEVDYISSNDWKTNNEYKQIIVDSISAKDMNCQIQVQVFRGEGPNEDGTDGAVASTMISRSVVDYAFQQLDLIAQKEEPTAKEIKLRTLLVDMLNYGAAAQLQFGHNVENLANADLSEEQRGYASTAVEEGAATAIANGEYAYGPSVTLKDTIYLNFYFQNLNSIVADGAYDKESLSAVVKFTTHRGTQETVHTIDSSEFAFMSNGNMIRVPVQELAAADVDTVVTCTLYYGATELSSISSNISFYCYNNISNADTGVLCELTLKYGRSAYNYFH